MFRVKITGFKGLQAEFAAATEKLVTIVSSEQQAAAQDWVARAQRDAPVDEGSLKRMITYVKRSEYAYEIISQAVHSPYMEFGTKTRYRPIPGTEQIAAQFRGRKGGDFRTLMRAILRWVRRKGIAGRFSVKTRRRLGGKIDQFAEDYAAAWPIVLSILKKGVYPQPFFFKQADVVWPQMVRNIERRLKRETKVAVILPGGISRPNITTI
jgi:hypothetical protein